jgi:hypothetical protein
MTPPATPAASTDRVKKLLVEGNTITDVARSARWPEGRVRALVTSIHGWLIDPKTDTVYQPDAQHMIPRLPDASPAAKPDKTGSVDELLAYAVCLDDKRIQRELTKALDAIGRLRQTVEEHGAQAEKARVLRATITELEKQLANARAEAKQLGIRTPRRTETAVETERPTLEELRAFAAERGLHCPPKGRVPQAVRTAYQEQNGASAQ